MKKHITFFLATALFSMLNLSAQTITDFESPINTSVAGGASFETISNPLQIGLNKTNTCGQIGRTSTTWWELVDVPCDFTIVAGETRYIHMMVLYAAQPDVSIRLNTNGTGPRAMNKYVNIGEWQDLVFEFTADETDITVSKIRILGDVGFENEPAGQILNNTDKFGLIDEIIVNTDPTPRSTPTSIKGGVNRKNYSVYSNSGRIYFKGDIDMKVNVYNSTGVLVCTFNQNQFEYTTPSKGLYIIQIGNISEKLIVQ